MQSAATDVANAPVAGAKTAQRPSIPEARCQIPESPAVGAAKSVGKTSPAAAGSAGAGGVSELEQALRRYVYASLREFGLQLQAHPIFLPFSTFAMSNRKIVPRKLMLTLLIQEAILECLLNQRGRDGETA